MNIQIQNDNEIIYLYQCCYKYKWIIKYFYKKYLPFLQKSSLQVFNKFYFLPFSIEILHNLYWEVLTYSLWKFKPFFGKTFKNYLIQNNHFFALNFIKHSLKHLTGDSYYVFYNTFHFWQVGEEDEKINSLYHESERRYQLELIYQQMHVLSETEKFIFLERLNGKTIQTIAKQNLFSYKQIDNATQRAIQKIKKTLLKFK